MLFEGCPPSQWTQPLSPDFKSAIDRFLPVLRVVWRVALGFEHDAWQIDVIRCIFEIDPATGHLRWRQYLVSMARQQGKSEIAAALAILALLLWPLGLVIGIASSADQARIVYQRTLNVIRSAPAFAKLFRKATEGRGIERAEGGVYQIKAAKGAALQGLAINLGVVDEVHLLKSELWTALVNGTGGRDDCLVVGITTAGDDDSKLLKHLYGEGEAGRIGFLLWEAPDRAEYANEKLPESDDVLWGDLKAAGPAYATGRVPRENVLADVRTLPPADAIRYRLNRFVKGSGSAALPLGLWASCAVAELPPLPERGVVFAVERTPSWGYATITANWAGHSEIVAVEVRPSVESLADLCASLAKHAPRAFVMDGLSLKALATELKARGLPVVSATLSDAVSAASLLYSNVAHKLFTHAGDPLLTLQWPQAKRKAIGEGWRVWADEGVSLDAVKATVIGHYFAETLPEVVPQLFV